MADTRKYVSINMQNMLTRRLQTFGNLPAGYKINAKGKIYISNTGNLSKSKTCPPCRPCIENENDENPNAGRPSGCPKCLPCTPNGKRITLRKRKTMKSRKTRKN